MKKLIFDKNLFILLISNFLRFFSKTIEKKQIFYTNKFFHKKNLLRKSNFFNGKNGFFYLFLLGISKKLNISQIKTFSAESYFSNF